MQNEDNGYEIADITVAVNLIVRAMFDELSKTKRVAVLRRIERLLSSGVLARISSAQKVREIIYEFLDVKKS